MNWLKKLVAKLFGIGHARPAPVDRPAKSVAFEASAQKVVDEHKLNDPWEAAAESIRRNRMFDDTVLPSVKKHMSILNPIDAVGSLPSGTTAKQFLALHKNPKEGDTIFIGRDVWAYTGDDWIFMGTTGNTVPSSSNNVSDHQARLDRYRKLQSRNIATSKPTRRDSRNDHDPLLDTFIIQQAVTDDTSYRSSHSRQDSHRHEDSTPSYRHTPSHSHSHDNNRHDDGGNYDSGGSDTSGSCD